MKRFKIKLFPRRYGLFFLPVALWVSINSAQANIICTASMNSGTVNIDNAITPVNADNESITGNLDYSCTNNGVLAVYASVYIGVDSGDSATLNPHYMSGPNGSKLAFTMTLPSGALWGNGSGSEYHPDPFLISPSKTVTQSIVVKAALLPGYNNVHATEGVHTNNSYITLTYDSTTDSTARLNYRNGGQAATQFPFTVKATVKDSCEITTKPTDINLKDVAASATSIKTSTSIGVRCTHTAPYTIGLTTRNGGVNNGGTDFMSRTDGKNDKLPYQLLRDNEKGGRVAWGNGTDSWAVDVGTGEAQTKIIYVTVPSADVKPGEYSDTVTISVNY